MNKTSPAHAAIDLLEQIRLVVSSLNSEEFTTPLQTLHHASIGQHIRHTIEFFICLREGLEYGTICYDDRRRDTEIETRPGHALSQIDLICEFLKSEPADRSLILNASYTDNEEKTAINTSFYRELAYDLEHAVHHLAIIRIGLAELKPALELPDGFGVAASTRRHRNTVQVG